MVGESTRDSKRPCRAEDSTSAKIVSWKILVDSTRPALANFNTGDHDTKEPQISESLTCIGASEGTCTFYHGVDHILTTFVSLDLG